MSTPLQVSERVRKAQRSALTMLLISNAINYIDPSEVTLTDAEIAYCTEGDPAGRPSPVTFREWKKLFEFRTTWGMMIGFFGIIYMSYIYKAWLPGYLEIQRHMSVQTAGIAAAIPFACGIGGSIAGGYSANRLIRAGQTALNSCKIPAALALVPRVAHNAGYSLFSLTRACAVVNCQFAFAWFRLRLSCQAATSSIRACLSGIRRSRHCDDRTLSSDSAMFSQLPCFGV